MRIVVIGDFHLDQDDDAMTANAMEDIARCKPDLVVPLGDFGSKPLTGGIEGMHEVKRFLDSIPASMRPILGNHDLQRESGTGPQPKGTMERELVKLFQLEQPYGVLEYEHFRLFFASTEPQPADSCYQVQECYTTEQQFSWLVNELKKRPGVPVIFFTHAPPIGCGLRTVPYVHVKSTNAYLDQNHDPYRWRQLYSDFPEIVMWFSAHYHLGHGHPDSHTVRSGTHFFMTGVHSKFTRDGNRQSRIIDITDEGVEVLTLDHIQRAVTQEGGYCHRKPLYSLMEGTEEPANRPAPAQLSCGDKLLERSAVCSVGEQPAMAQGIHPLSSERYIVTTEEGYSWEVEPESEAVIGTLHIGAALKTIAVADESLWMAWDGHIGNTALDSLWRFVRKPEQEWPARKWLAEAPVERLTAHPSGGVWAASSGAVRRIANVQGDSNSTVLNLSAEPSKLVASQEDVWILGRDGRLWRWDGTSDEAMQTAERLAAFDAQDGSWAGITCEQGTWSVHVHRSGQTEAVIVPLPESEISALNESTLDADLVLLDDNSAVALLNGKVYYIDLTQYASYLLSENGGGTATAIARSLPRSGAQEPYCRFALSRKQHPVLGRPQLELWTVRNA